MAKSKVKLSIIILSWNTRELLRQCLESVTSDQLSVDGGAKKGEKKLITDHQSLITEIIVVDNGSTDGSVKVIKSIKPKVETEKIKLILIENKENLGYAKGNNLGIKNAKGEYIMILNSDTIVKEGSIEKLINFLDDHQEVDIVGPKLLDPDGSPQPNCGRFLNIPVVFMMLFKEHFRGSKFVRWSPDKSVFVDWLMGAAFVARKKVFEAIGGFDERIFMYMEEVEWFYRAAKAGFKAYFLADSEIVHLGRGSSKTGKKEPILNIYKGIIYFFHKHKSLPELAAVKIMLKLKAAGALLVGYLKNDNYLKQTYGEALKIN